MNQLLKYKQNTAVFDYMIHLKSLDGDVIYGKHGG